MRPAWIAVAVVALLVVGFGAARLTDPGNAAATPSQVAVAPSSAPTAAPTPTPAPTPTTSPSAPPEPAPILDGAIVPIGGWTSLGGMSGDGRDASGGAGTLSGTMPAGWTAVMVSVACAGRGSLHIESGDDTRDVRCPVTTTAPERAAFFADTPSYRVRVTRDGQVAYEVRVDGARSVLVRPPVVVTGNGKPARMTEGCGISIQLAWGFNAVDDCATNIPGDPMPTVPARDGRVDIRIPGWTIADAKVRCGRIGPNDIPSSSSCVDATRVPGSTARRRRSRACRQPAAAGSWSSASRRGMPRATSSSVPYYAWVRP